MNNSRIIVLGSPQGARGGAVAEGKFVHLRWRGADQLLFAPFERHRFHNQLVAEFAAEQGIAHHWSGAEQLAVNDTGLQLRGGGLYRVYPQEQLLELWGRSLVYGRFQPGEVRALLAAAEHPWAAYDLSMD